MQGTHPLIGTSSSMFTNVLARSRSFFTPTRVGFALAGAFFITGTTAAFSDATEDQRNSSARPNLAVQASIHNTSAPEDSPSDQAAPAASASSDTTITSRDTTVQLNVNGQKVDLPQNGSVQKMVPTPDGTSQSSVNVSTSSNASASSVNVNISSENSSTGTGSSTSSIIIENGGSTIIDK